MKHYTDYSLTQSSTMRTQALAKNFLEIESVEDLAQISQVFGKDPWYVLGEGSNTLFTQNYAGTIVHMATKGVKVASQGQVQVVLEVAAGEDWPSLVKHCVSQGFAGIENLALIPGTAGAAPVQNIAAYGQSVSDVIESVTFFDPLSNQTQTISRLECHFGYRDSIFKHELSQKIIISVRLLLSLVPKLAVNYYSIGRRRDSIQNELAKKSKPPYSISDVYDAVVSIRTNKLPNWHTTPTIGSFFKNPLISKEEANDLEKKVNGLQLYPADSLSYVQANDPTFSQSDFVKVPAGRLLDELGWAEKQIGHVFTYNHWASIITHDGEASGQEILAFAQAMSTDVREKFGIELEAEVNIV